MKLTKNKYRAVLAAVLTIIIISPIDDVILAALFGTALFGFGSTAFYLLLIASSAISITLWKKHNPFTLLRRMPSVSRKFKSISKTSYD